MIISAIEESARLAGSLGDAVRAAGPRAGWLCDLDGTVVDSMALHHRAYAMLFAELGGTLSRADFDAHVGPPARVTVPLFAQAAGLDPAALPDFAQLHARKKHFLQDILASSRPTELATAGLIRQAPADIAIAIVTSGNRDGAENILRSISLRERITALISGDDVTHGKPDPEPYATACHAMGLAPSACLAFEDHPDGIASAIAAGVDVIDVVAGRLLLAGQGAR
ncbi:HAD family hydrolase [Sphingomonas hylomeconis]|uniref:HAD family hydrolase n=1 Tax=Sphingomonas hylomeconis TaxID=1395958 RepID=A0ABV7SWY3_9SPHN|nr:HAD family phosphatase [Sphingomonas hylomeconis]